jgi:hypothetical protein
LSAPARRPWRRCHSTRLSSGELAETAT